MSHSTVARFGGTEGFCELDIKMYINQEKWPDRHNHVEEEFEHQGAGILGRRRVEEEEFRRENEEPRGVSFTAQTLCGSYSTVRRRLWEGAVFAWKRRKSKGPQGEPDSVEAIMGQSIPKSEEKMVKFIYCEKKPLQKSEVNKENIFWTLILTLARKSFFVILVYFLLFVYVSICVYTQVHIHTSVYICNSGAMLYVILQVDFFRSVWWIISGITMID